MRHTVLAQQLTLLSLLVENRTLTVEALAERLHTTPRNIYYALRFLRESPDFELEKRGPCYSVSRQSPFVARMCEAVKFTDDEIVTMKRLLDEADRRNPVVERLRHKFSHFYDPVLLADERLRGPRADIAATLYRAMQEERMVIINGYRSPHSGTVADRLLEPFTFLNANRDIRAFEPASGLNKTFRLSRMEGITLLDARWANAGSHRRLFTDIFNFASETTTPVTLRLDTLAYHVLVEEYPRAEMYVRPLGGGLSSPREEENCRRETGDLLEPGNPPPAESWLFEAPVCSMLGVGRFVLGLYDHIRVVGTPALTAYLNNRLTAFTRQCYP